MAHIISSLLDPVTLFMVGVIIGVSAYFIKKKLGASIIIIALLQLWLLSIPSIPGLMAHYMERGVNNYSGNPEVYDLNNRSIDFIIIMGGSNTSNSKSSNSDQLGTESIKRFFEGLAIANKHESAKIIISGNGYHSDHVRDTLTDWGIAEERIILNPNVRNTQYELEGIAKILQQGNYAGSSLMIVSTATHIARVKIWARYYGLFPLYSGVSYKGFVAQSPTGLYQSLATLVPSAQFAGMSHEVLHEVAGIVYAKIFTLRNKYL